MAAALWFMAIASVALWNAPWWLAGTAVLGALPAAGTLGGRRAVRLALLGALFAYAGAARFEPWFTRAAPDVARYSGQEVTLEGMIASEPDPSQTAVAYTVRVDAVDDGAGLVPSGGKVLIRLGEYAEHWPGEHVRVRGELEEPASEGEYAYYRGYLARQDIVAAMLFPQVEVTMPAPTWGWRHRLARARLALEDALQRALPEPAAALGGGIAFGRDDTLAEDLKDDFRTTGLAHIVAVSGSNVSMVTALVFFLAIRFMRRQWAAVPAAVTLVAYVAIAGLDWSVIRAGLMAAVLLGGLWAGRPQSSLAALGAATVAMTLVTPSAALDVGFQLSFAATAGLIVFGPWIAFGLGQLLRSARAEAFVPGSAVQVVALSISATIATLPIVWINFERVSLIGVVLNVIVEPLFLPAFWLSLLTAVTGAVWDPAGWAIGLAAYYPLAFITWLAETGAEVPGAAVPLGRGSGGRALLVYVLAAIPGWLAFRHLVPVEPRAAPSARARAVHRGLLATGAGAVVAVVLPVSLLPAAGPGALRIDVLDVGQGDAILLTTPHGHQVLVDGGPSGIELARQAGASMPHWDHTIDTVVLTHADIDHLSGLIEAGRRFRIGEVVAAREGGTSDAYTLWRSEAAPVRQVAAGDHWELDGVRFDVLWPAADGEVASTNDASVVLLVTYEGRTALLTGDIEGDVQRVLMSDGLGQADLLKVPHHGSKTSDPAFFARVAPVAAVISAGADNRFGHPHEETLAALAGTPVFRTDRDGRVTFYLDAAGLRGGR